MMINMRVTERQPDKLGAYSNSVGGGATFYFKKSEWDHVFSEIQEYINGIINRNNTHPSLVVHLLFFCFLLDQSELSSMHENREI